MFRLEKRLIESDKGKTRNFLWEWLKFRLVENFFVSQNWGVND
jgi:hypothetical protein